MKVANAVAKILKKEGVEFLIGYPVNQIIEAAAEEDIRTIIVRQERVGLHMADAVSRISSGQRIGVFAMQHGPGTENAFGGVAQAFGDSVLIVLLPGGYPRKLLNITPNFSSLLNLQHVTKWSEQVILPDDQVLDLEQHMFHHRRGGERVVERFGGRFVQNQGHGASFLFLSGCPMDCEICPTAAIVWRY